MMDESTMAKAKAIQLGLQQFEVQHTSIETEDNNGNKVWICAHCTVDFPCDRMLLFMLLQGIASLTAMIPTGNMAGVMQRFMKNG